jgi:hypothetical protein
MYIPRNQSCSATPDWTGASADAAALYAGELAQMQLLTGTSLATDIPQVSAAFADAAKLIAAPVSGDASGHANAQPGSLAQSFSGGYRFGGMTRPVEANPPRCFSPIVLLPPAPDPCGATAGGAGDSAEGAGHGLLAAALIAAALII